MKKDNWLFYENNDLFKIHFLFHALSKICLSMYPLFARLLGFCYKQASVASFEGTLSQSPAASFCLN